MLLHRTRLTLGVGTFVLSLALTGCAAGPDPTAAARSEETKTADSPSKKPRSKAPSPAPAQSPSPTESSAPAAPESPATEPSAAAASKPADRLLTASEMPGFGDGYTWQEVATRKSEGDQPFGTCHKYAMTSIGAMSVVVRQYRPTAGASTDTAGHLVADFADERTARRAFEVLKSWRGQCEEELAGYERRDIGGLQGLDAAGADAGWYLLFYGPLPGHAAQEGYFDAQGMTRVGKRISVLRMRTVDRDDRKPQRDQPMVDAVHKASTKLG
jgi:hypothetical protein